VRRLLTGLAAALGGAWVLKRLRRAHAGASAPAGDDPADELRRKLAESRTAVPEPAEAEAPAAPQAPGVDERRRTVHERGREAIDRMRGRDADPG